MTMDRPCWYEIRVEGQLTQQWSAWFDGLVIRIESNAETTLSGWIADQAALLGVLTRIHNLNLILISVYRSSPEL
ncbi:hypothetical protein TFLX_05419 [Thermoflexales bacterium]|jgi:hypothetical protein|nr:hypothetical protein TFLX_05419 [Thermoflexales bacterium]